MPRNLRSQSHFALKFIFLSPQILVKGISIGKLLFNYKFHTFIDFTGGYSPNDISNRKFLFKMPIFQFFINFKEIVVKW